MTPPSLRELYTDPTQTWSFVPPKVHPQPTLSYDFHSRPSSSFRYPDDLELEPHVPIAKVFKALVASAVLQYTSTAIVMPWEVGKLLLQVQWVPRDAGEVVESEDEVEGGVEPPEEGEEGMSDVDEETAESYFADPNDSRNMNSNVPNSRPPPPRPRVDENGYVIRRSVLEEGTRPEYIIPVGSASGVWGMMKRVGRHRTEGWLSLWKGLLTSCITEILSDTLQPLTHTLLKSLLFPSLPSSPYHQTHQSASGTLLPILSHLITGFLLSPLDLVRTRLIIQSSQPRYKTYPKSPLSTLSQILEEEGGLKGVYFHPHLLIPTLLDNALRPIVALFLPRMLITYLGYGYITEDTHPVAWGLAELAGSCLGLLVTLPIETIRRRLQAQVRGNGSIKPVKACVELRPKPYNGLVDAFWHILTEERSDLPIVPARRKRKRTENVKPGDEDEDRNCADAYESWWKHTGLGQLYRGLGMRLGASAVVFLLALLGGGVGAGKDEGWAEI